MKINLKSVNWYTLVPAIAATTKLIFQSFGIDVPEQEVNDWLNVASVVIAPLGVALSHRKITIPTEVIEAVQQAPKTYSDMVPIMSEVNLEINSMLEQIKSGKYTAATQDAIDTYQKIYELIKLKKGA